jgi:hypothetical protein
MQDDITKAKSNLDKIISFNRDLRDNANMKLDNAYSLLSQTDNLDLGLQIGVNLMSGSFWVIGASTMGDMGSLVANFLSGLISYYTSETPPSLNTLFSSLLVRIQNTLNQANNDLAIYHSNPELYWNKELSGSFSTPFGNYKASGKLSDLAKIDFPVQSDPLYYTIQNACLKALDQGIWAILLTRFFITDYQEDLPPMWPLPINPEEEDNKFIAKNKSYYSIWEYHEEKDCYGNLNKYYHREQYNLGTGASAFSDGSLNDDACNYLFQNYSSEICNKDGLFNRDFVFNNLNIPIAIHYIHNVHSNFCFRKRKNLRK